VSTEVSRAFAGAVRAGRFSDIPDNNRLLGRTSSSLAKQVTGVRSYSQARSANTNAAKRLREILAADRRRAQILTVLASLAPSRGSSASKPRMLGALKKRRLPDIVTDPVLSAKEAGLRYVTDAQPGIRRRKSGKGFRYFDADGKPVRDRETLQRIRSLVIPPAWTEVWICADERGHLQATGRDARGRKQSRYHPRWRVVRDETKYERMLLFGTALRRLRARLEEDLALPGLPRNKVLATIVRLMERTLIRVGNEEYARENGSYGLTTMRAKHAQVNGSKVVFHFRGKSGKLHAVGVEDRRLARIVRQCQDLPGHELFEYRDELGETRKIDSADVNDYLRAVTGEDFTAKDFRTWAGTVLAAMALREFEEPASETEAKKNVVQAIKAAAQQLGNTPAVCRRCYVHPAVLECYLAGKLERRIRRKVKEATDEVLYEAEEEALREEERAVIQLLQERLGTNERR
jgi:DNA topoisomerase I